MISRARVERWIAQIKDAHDTVFVGDLEDEDTNVEDPGESVDCYEERDIDAVLVDMEQAVTDSLRDEVSAEVRVAPAQRSDR